MRKWFKNAIDHLTQSLTPNKTPLTPQISLSFNHLTVTKIGTRSHRYLHHENPAHLKKRTTNSAAHDGDAARDGEALRRDDGKGQKEEGKELVHLARLSMRAADTKRAREKHGT